MTLCGCVLLCGCLRGRAVERPSAVAHPTKPVPCESTFCCCCVCLWLRCARGQRSGCRVLEKGRLLPWWHSAAASYCVGACMDAQLRDRRRRLLQHSQCQVSLRFVVVACACGCVAHVASGAAVVWLRRVVCCLDDTLRLRLIVWVLAWTGSRATVGGGASNKASAL